MRIFLSMCCMLFIMHTSGQTKRAFIVAIGDYSDFRSWKHISSVDDIPYIKAGLFQFGFEEKNIDTLTNERATKDRILKELDAFAGKCLPGDIAVFVFCGHGQQVMDDPAHPDEFDGYDEALVPFETSGRYDPVSNTGDKHLRDDELFVKLKAIHDKVGSNGTLMVLIDACHSGTATRADEFLVARGSPKPLAPDDFVPRIQVALDQKGGGFSDNAPLEHMIVFSASGADQLNYQTKDEQGKGVGVLSYAFAKTCMELKPGDNYALMFEKMKARIQANKPTQVPIMEGDGRREVFGSRFTPVSDIIAVNAAQWRDDSSFVLERGYLHDLTPGSTFHLTKLGQLEVVGRGYIVRTEALQSMAVVSTAMSKTEGYAVVMDELVPEQLQSVVFINARGKNTQRTGKLKAEVEQQMKAYPWIRQDNPADLMLELVSGNTDSVYLVDKNGRAIYASALAAGEGMTQERWKPILQKINADTRVRYLRDLPDGGTLAEGIRAGISSTSRSLDTLRNEYVFEAGDQFVISLENKGGRKLYFNLINITPDNKINLLLPAPGLTAAQCQLLPRNVYNIPPLKISAGTPPGKEVFKIILSEQSFDLGPIVKQLNDAQKRGVKGSIENLFDDMYNDADTHLVKKRSLANVEINKVGVVTVGYSVR